MKRVALPTLSLFAVSLLSGCCMPGYSWWSPWGCQSGQCQPGGYGGGYPAAQPTGWNTGYDYSTASYPVYSTIAAQPVVTQPTQIAYPAQPYPTMAVESLPTYR